MVFPEPLFMHTETVDILGTTAAPAGPRFSELHLLIFVSAKGAVQKKNDSLFESCRLPMRIRGLEPPPSCPD